MRAFIHVNGLQVDNVRLRGMSLLTSSCIAQERVMDRQAQKDIRRKLNCSKFESIAK
jgi:hypothetical protein